MTLPRIQVHYRGLVHHSIIIRVPENAVTVFDVLLHALEWMDDDLHTGYEPTDLAFYTLQGVQYDPSAPASIFNKDDRVAIYKSTQRKPERIGLDYDGGLRVSEIIVPESAKTVFDLLRYIVEDNLKLDVRAIDMDLHRHGAALNLSLPTSILQEDDRLSMKPKI